MPDIRPALTPDDLLAVYRFRYSVYVEEMGRAQKYADHNAKIITDPLDVPAAHVLAAWEAGEVVGTVRYNFLRSSDIGEYAEQYAIAGLAPDLLAATSITTRLMVHPRHRRTTLATRLACEAYRRALDCGTLLDFIDCNAHLVEYFAGLGYRPHRTDFVHPEYGAVTVMRLDLTDRPHLESVRSPFRRIHRTWEESRAAPTTGE